MQHFDKDPSSSKDLFFPESRRWSLAYWEDVQVQVGHSLLGGDPVTLAAIFGTYSVL